MTNYNYTIFYYKNIKVIIEIKIKKKKEIKV